MNEEELVTYRCYDPAREKWFDPNAVESWSELESTKTVKLASEEECFLSIFNYVANDVDALVGIWIVPCRLGSVSYEGLIDLEPDFIAAYMSDNRMIENAFVGQ